MCAGRARSWRSDGDLQSLGVSFGRLADAFSSQAYGYSIALPLIFFAVTAHKSIGTSGRIKRR